MSYGYAGRQQRAIMRGIMSTQVLMQLLTVASLLRDDPVGRARLPSFRHASGHGRHQHIARTRDKVQFGCHCDDASKALVH